MSENSSDAFSFFPADFIKAFHKAREEPTKKYTMPQTESQEIGWISTPLVRIKNDFENLNYAYELSLHSSFCLLIPFSCNYEPDHTLPPS